MQEYMVKQIYDLKDDELTILISQSKDEGFRFLQRLIDDYENEKNRFLREYLSEQLKDEIKIISI